ncbi:ComEC family competence protein [Flavobacterium circumlabens]|uniref:ComEC family competence protein n=1 Tax=Flavobacterium circumlabens TaxID=2133765 RepID=A0A4Y7UJ98_9FLAO|nr:ComEC/Rec2 family competence protein [Flavobacterium circumlabens]TCN60760.1 competence protein ComEC [Flavobacterium circumlabens]TEB45902.1 ComEC family competence protein [Flavobacterium circumlabens]
MKVLDFPLAKITICFIIGILVCYYWQPTIFLAVATIIITAILFLMLYFLSGKNKKLLLFFGISTCLISFWLGIITLLLHTDSLQQSNYIHCKKAFENEQNISFTLMEQLKSNSYNDRYVALLNHIESNTYTGKIIVNIKKDNLRNTLIIGNIIQAKVTLQHTTAPKNPNQFDYGKYLANKQIYAQVYLSKAEIEVSKKIRKNVWFYAARLNSRIIRNLEKAHFNKTEMNVAMGLILGQRQEISSDILKDYQYSGATHILSVSGLHVGFIMLFILFILKPISNTRKGSFIKLIAILISLSLFGIISGLSPPVLRSVVMFSFLAIGNHLRRGSNIYHTLLISILLILLFEPYFLFDAGFQLSYIALFSILWIQPLLKEIWKPKNKISTYIWEALTVSFAAQIGTFPVCLYYFHQFPCLFFVTNILILPVLSFTMITGIVVMLISAFFSCPVFLIQIFEKSIYILNLITHTIASMEYFVIRDISFNFYYLITFYLLTIAIIFWFKKPTYPKVMAIFISVILVQLSFIMTKKDLEEKQELIVYNVKKKTIITERNGKKMLLFTNEDLKKNSKALSIIGNTESLHDIQKIKNTFFFNSKKILLIDSSGVYKRNSSPDILILTQSPKINLDRVLLDLKPKIIVADASNSYSIQNYWKTSCSKKRIPFHATGEMGFYKLN